MRRASFIVATILCCHVLAQTTLPADQPLKAVLLAGMGNHHHRVSTANAEAQQFFDQGVSLLFAFNHDEAMRSFIHAAELDPNLAMAHWGIAMTLGPNYNVDVDPPRETAAYEEIQKAIKLSPETSTPEKDYIAAAAKHFSKDPNPDLKKLASDYCIAMAELSRKHPDDLDAATFYAESLMLLHPWQLWNRDGKPGDNTLKIVEVLESVLKRNPDHIGANHFYIHAVEASPHPEWALESAAILPGLAPAAGHLVHMPAHIYSRVGDHVAAAGSNAAAIAADEDYLKTRDDHGIYPMMYFSHNIHFLAYSNAMQGRFADAKKAADQLAEHVGPHVAMMPMLEGFSIMPTVILMRFGKWEEILKLPAPSEKLPASQIFYHLARGLAFAGSNKPEEAEKERDLMNGLAKGLPGDAMFGPLNSAADVFGLANSYLAARIALSRNNLKDAIALLGKARTQEDALIYDEPPDWWLPSREALGMALLRDQKPAEAEEVFRKELQSSPRSGRALLGLVESLKAQNKSADAEQVNDLLKTAWKNADAPMRWQDL